jgi:putative transposase
MVRVLLCSRADMALEILALRHQVAVLKRKLPRPTLNACDRLFWSTPRRFGSRWRDVLVIARPETVVAWHRASSGSSGVGAPSEAADGRISRLRLTCSSNAWRRRTSAGEHVEIHSELQKLGYVVSERTVARYLRRLSRRDDPGKRWLAFLQNHREMITAFGFFTVPTVTFQLLYCFFVIEHGRRKILHINLTRHPNRR